MIWLDDVLVDESALREVDPIAENALNLYAVDNDGSERVGEFAKRWQDAVLSADPRSMIRVEVDVVTARCLWNAIRLAAQTMRRHLERMTDDDDYRKAANDALDRARRKLARHWKCSEDEAR